MQTVFLNMLYPKQVYRRTSGVALLKRKRLRKLKARMRRLRSDMQEINGEQKMIKKGQRQVREKFGAIELEFEQLRKQTSLIMEQSLSTQIRLPFMFRILKARQNQEFVKAAELTVAFRKVIARENQWKETMATIAEKC